MTRSLVIVRPEPGCSETCAAARELGLNAVPAPLFEVLPTRWDVPDPTAFDCIVAGSANAFRHGGAGLAALRSLPVLAVGERTAEAARAEGFGIAAIGRGGLQQMIGQLRPQRLLRLAGEARVDLRLPEGCSMEERVVYRTEPVALAGGGAAALAAGAVVLLHSGEAARRFAAECARLDIDRANVSLAALAPRIADAAGGGWSDVLVAREVTDSALLALAVQLCQ